MLPYPVRLFRSRKFPIRYFPTDQGAELLVHIGMDAWKKEGAMGLVVKDKGIQAIYGPKADVIKSDINDIL